MFRLLLVLLVAGLLLMPSITQATIWRVPSQCPTIQAGIDSASAGDTVIVAAGTYYEHNIVMKSGILLRSSTGMADCVTIDAQGYGRIFFCDGVDNATCIKGFTIFNGEAFARGCGGGMFCRDSNLAIRQCNFVENAAYFFGGGGPGGGLYLENSSPMLDWCVFTENGANYRGGGIYCVYYSSPGLTHCTFSNNRSAASAGGGMACEHYCFPRLIDCVFAGNSATFGYHEYFCGGGMHCASGSSARLTRCVFLDNTALSPVPEYIPGRGGGIYAFGSVLIDCTFVGNSADLGAGFYGTSTLENTLIAFNTTGEGAHGSSVLSCCNLYGNEGGDWVGGIADQYGVNGNFSEDPLFCDDCLYLQDCSPCVEGYGCGQVGAYGAGCPCGGGPSRVEATTWSRVKEMFRASPE